MGSRSGRHCGITGIPTLNVSRHPSDLKSVAAEVGRKRRPAAAARHRESLEPTLHLPWRLIRRFFHRRRRCREKRWHSMTFSSVRSICFPLLWCRCTVYSNHVLVLSNNRHHLSWFIYIFFSPCKGSIDRDSDIGDARSLLDLDVTLTTIQTTNIRKLTRLFIFSLSRADWTAGEG